MFNDRAENQPLEVQKETYLNRLPDRDKHNIETVKNSFKASLGARGMKGALVAVGGSIDKPLPRKDIDILVIIAAPSEPRGSRLTPYRRALKDHERISELVSDAKITHPEIQIVEEIKPLIDEEFQSESILRHDGSIKISFPEGTPLEFIRSGNDNGVVGAIQKGKPYVVLETV